MLFETKDALVTREVIALEKQLKEKTMVQLKLPVKTFYDSVSN